MRNLPDRAKRYFFDTLGLTINFDVWKKEKSLPFFLSAGFDIRSTEILGLECIFVFCMDEIGPADIYKHDKHLSKYASIPRIYVVESLTLYARTQLIQMRLPFVVPSTQMYLPNLYMDLRENTLTASKQPLSEYLTPSAQAAAIYLLYKSDEILSTAELTEIFGYSRMTASRVINDLCEFDFISKDSGKKQSWIRLNGTHSEIWRELKGRFRSPLREVFFVEGEPMDWQHKGGISVAGETALSRYSMLGAPRVAEYAMDKEAWKFFNHNNEDIIRSDEDYFIVREIPYSKVQVWSYRPDMIEDGCADRISLYLTLARHEDERVSMSIDEMMECLNWFRD